VVVHLLLTLFYTLPGIADIVGRRLGKRKLPYNPNKSYAGSIAMAMAGFLASIG
jgi:farnesol kinase